MGSGRLWVAGLILAIVFGFAVGRSTFEPPAQGPALGPTRLVSQVPLGFPHSPTGAVNAVLSHGGALGSPSLLISPGRRAQVLSLVATPRYAEAFHGRAAAALDVARRGPIGQALRRGEQTVYLAHPLAYRVVSYRPSEATIETWGVAVVGTAAVQPRASWSQSVTSLRWVNGDWRVDRVRSEDGPTPAPAGGAQPTEPPAFTSQLAALKGVRGAP